MKSKLLYMAMTYQFFILLLLFTAYITGAPEELLLDSNPNGYQGYKKLGLIVLLGIPAILHAPFVSPLGNSCLMRRIDNPVRRHTIRTGGTLSWR